MKHLKPFTLIALLIIGLVGCKDDTESISRVTNYPNFEFTGSGLIIHQLGDPFSDPGVTATEAGSDIPVTVSEAGVYMFGSGLDVNVADLYQFSYSATNKDGFAGSVSRDVYVVNNGDLVSSIEGIYTSTIVRNGVVSAQYEDLAYIIIWKNTDGTYEFSDGIGGYYDYGRGYGNAYIAPGLVVTANDIATNDFTFEDFSVRSFGGVCTVTGMTVDAGSMTINLVTNWDAGPYDFDVTLTQVQF